MIKFFRHIRKRLLAENRFSRYLIYAIGEIILVVIGILIALQINNWNENRKMENQELKMLNELLVNLRADSIDHTGNMDWYGNASKSAEIVVQSLESQSPWNDTMALHYGWIFMKGIANLNTSAYENLKSRGFNIIRNDTIRKELTELHTIEYDRLLKYENEFSIDNSNQLVVPVFLKRLRMDKWWHATPLNYKDLLKDLEFREVVRWKGITMGFMKSHCKTSLRKVIKLMRMIERELERRGSI
jgi:hypothetical protein